ncbi:MAG: DUF883 domain-containing protein [Rhodobacteraceae bacterium]|uniref:DUF883 family protein n=1 Tax=Celeribacter sp. HF31 TaxID=2721558 RepID=UPI00142F626C|nr:DUF883 family protein [Celeribacter sp. HF31]NIY78386.1 DUF883 domain-containing protein [Celeribacter sp. HF31]NVK46755.1 DUF883 domain-containing protein [Paracoccaceae bacterium]
MARAQTNGTVEETSADLSAQIATLKADVAELTNTLADYGRAQKAQLGATAEDSFEAAKQKGVETADYARQQARDAYAGAEKTVRENPAASVGIAAGVGFLVGLLASRRS